MGLLRVRRFATVSLFSVDCLLVEPANLTLTEPIELEALRSDAATETGKLNKLNELEIGAKNSGFRNSTRQLTSYLLHSMVPSLMGKFLRSGFGSD